MLLNLGYLLMLIALVIRDILGLRLVLISAQLSLAAYALSEGLNNVAIWNVIFVFINTVQILRLLRERKPIKLPGDIQDLYDNVFNPLSAREFLYFWQMGTLHTVTDETLIHQGEKQQDISLILSGKVEVIKDKQLIATLERSSFIAEMSFLTGDLASADVKAKGEVRYISWNQEKLKHLETLKPHILIMLQSILGTDLAHKMK